MKGIQATFFKEKTLAVFEEGSYFEEVMGLT
jgi:hypothetical protein